MSFYPRNEKLGQKVQGTPKDAGLAVDEAFVAHLHLSAEEAAAADTNGVHAAADGGAHTFTSNITNPPYPRNITATAGGTAGDIKAIQVKITGTDIDDNVITEDLPAFTVDTPGTVEGSKAFKTVTKIEIPAHDDVGATTEIGFGDKVGLPHKLSHNTVLKTYVNNALEGTAPTVATSASALSGNTVDPNSALAGTPVDIYYLV